MNPFPILSVAVLAESGFRSQPDAIDALRAAVVPSLGLPVFRKLSKVKVRGQHREFLQYGWLLRYLHRMKAVIPLAGRGTRLRPHTHLTPKPLIRVAGKPVLDYILDDLLEVGVSEVIFVVGHLRDSIRTHIETSQPRIRARYVVQEIQDGTAGAVALARPWVDGELLILFADTLFEVDLTIAGSLDAGRSGVIWAKEVEDYSRFGVIVTDANGDMTRIVEKPREPVSRLANIGLYYIRDHELLFEGIEDTRTRGPGPSGEYYLTDAFQYMVDAGARILTAPVRTWLDAGKVDALLDANRYLVGVGGGRGGVDRAATVSESAISPLSRIEAGARVTNSRIGDNVTVEAGARVSDSELGDTIVGAGARVERSRLHGSLIGSHAVVTGCRGCLNIMDHSEVRGGPPPGA